MATKTPKTPKSGTTTPKAARVNRLDTDFYGKKSLLTATKVARVLTRLGVSRDAFQGAYLADNGRPRREITTETRQAIEDFNSGKIGLAAAMEATGYKTEVPFLNFRARVMAQASTQA